MKDVEKIKALLNQNQTFWVCPVSGVKIPASDTGAISAHKDKIVQAAEAKAQAAVKTKKKKEWKQKRQEIASLQDLNYWLFINESFGKTPMKKVPDLVKLCTQKELTGLKKIASATYKSVLFDEKNYVILKFKAAPDNKQMMALNALGSTQKINGAHYLSIPSKEIPLLHKNVLDFYSNDQGNKMTMEKKQLLATTKYPELVKELNDLTAKLSAVRESLREKTAKRKALYEDFVNKSTDVFVAPELTSTIAKKVQAIKNVSAKSVKLK